MPTVAAKGAPPSSFRMRLGPAVGKVNDLWALAYCPELDEAERENNPDHDEVTFVLHFRAQERRVVAKVPYRLNGLWRQDDGRLWAVGDRVAVVEVGPSGLVEHPLTKISAQFSSIWGSGIDPLFVTGLVTPTILKGDLGHWQSLALPPNTENVRDVCGFTGQDVYFVGDHGQIHHFDGQVVTRLGAPVRRHLTAITRLDASRMCVGGYQGTLMVGNRHGWRHLATNVADPLLALAAFDGKVYYGADEQVWATDGGAPVPSIDFAARWLSALDDGLVLSHEESAVLVANGAMSELDLRT